MIEDEMVGWHQRLNGCEFEQAPGGEKTQPPRSSLTHSVFAMGLLPAVVVGGTEMAPHGVHPEAMVYTREEVVRG